MTRNVQAPTGRSDVIPGIPTDRLRSPAVTKVYAELDQAKAAEVMARIG
jgi:hypothetical protein